MTVYLIIDDSKAAVNVIDDKSPPTPYPVYPPSFTQVDITKCPEDTWVGCQLQEDGSWLSEVEARAQNPATEILDKLKEIPPDKLKSVVDAINADPVVQAAVAIIKP